VKTLSSENVDYCDELFRTWSAERTA
jgi:hypothetical protein